MTELVLDLIFFVVTSFIYGAILVHIIFPDLRIELDTPIKRILFILLAPIWTPLCIIAVPAVAIYGFFHSVYAYIRYGDEA